MKIRKLNLTQSTFSRSAASPASWYGSQFRCCFVAKLSFVAHFASQTLRPEADPPLAEKVCSFIHHKSLFGYTHQQFTAHHNPSRGPLIQRMVIQLKAYSLQLTAYTGWTSRPPLPVNVRNCTRRNFAHLVIVIAVILFTFAKTGFAAPAYGTDMPEKGEWVKALEANIVFKRKLDDSYGKFKSRQYFLDLSYGLRDWIALDFKIGVGSLIHKPTDSYGINYDTNFAGGYGFRVQVFDNPSRGLKGVLGFQHISVHLPTEKVGADKNRAILDDWQISALLSKDFLFFVPYLGVKISRSDLIEELNGERKRKKSSELPGLVVGTDIRLGEKLKLNIESRFFDETALSTRLNLPF